MENITEAGTYTARVVKPHLGWYDVSATKNTPYLKIGFDILDEECNGDQIGKRIFAEVYLTDKTLERAMKTLKDAFGAASNALEKLSNDEDEWLIGQEAELVVEMQEYNGKFYPRVKYINNINGAGQKMASDELKKVIAVLSKKAVAIGAAQAQPAATQDVRRQAKPAKPAVVSDDDDDIPF